MYYHRKPKNQKKDPKISILNLKTPKSTFNKSGFFVFSTPQKNKWHIF